MRRILLLTLAIIAVVEVAWGQESADGSMRPIRTLDWSPNGQLIAVGYRDGEVEIFAVETKQIVDTFQPTNTPVVEVAWHPIDPSKLAVASGYGLLTIIDIEAPSAWVFAEPVQYIDAITWSPDGKKIAGAVRHVPSRDISSYALLIWDAETGSDLAAFRSRDYVFDLEWSPDGTQILSSGVDENFVVLDAQSGSSLMTFPAFGYAIEEVAWSPNGRYVATVAVGDNADTLSGVQVWDTETGEVIASYLAEAIRDIAWDSLGLRVGIADDVTVKVLDIAADEVITVVRHTDTVFALDWSPDGTQIAFGGADTTGSPPQVMIVDAPHLPEIAPTPTP